MLMSALQCCQVTSFICSSVIRRKTAVLYAAQVASALALDCKGSMGDQTGNLSMETACFVPIRCEIERLALQSGGRNDNEVMHAMPIFFYSTLGDYACFSNFSPHGFEVDGVYWPTVEHYFQAQKYAGTEYEEQIRQAKSPKHAKTLGQRRDWPLRPDWEDVKLDIMR